LPEGARALALSSSSFTLAVTVENSGRLDRVAALAAHIAGVRHTSSPVLMTIGGGDTVDRAIQLEVDLGAAFDAAGSLDVKVTLRDDRGVIVDERVVPLPIERPTLPEAPAAPGENGFRWELGPDLGIAGVAVTRVRRHHADGVGLGVRVTVENAGNQTWGFDGNVWARLYKGTPETELAPVEEILGEPGPYGLGIPRTLPGNLRAGTDNEVTLVLGRLPNAEHPAFAGTPPVLDLEHGRWYTLEVLLDSSADGTPANNRLQLVFILGDDYRIAESRLVRARGAEL
jgi:hypothetical protein